MKTKKRFEKEKLRRGIYIVPNIFTSLNLFCGFYSIISSINGDFVAVKFEQAAPVSDNFPTVLFKRLISSQAMLLDRSVPTEYRMTPRT